MPAGRICITNGCGKTAAVGARCVGCAAERERGRGTRQQRGYGAEHDRIRARLLLAWAVATRSGVTWRCPHCGQPLVPGEPVDAAHYGQSLLDNPAAKADRLAHERCNRGDRTGTRSS